jgi:hypothetical protein
MKQQIGARYFTSPRLRNYFSILFKQIFYHFEKYFSSIVKEPIANSTGDLPAFSAFSQY